MANESEVPNFFSKTNPVNISLYYDYNKETFVASATLAATGAAIFEETDEEDPSDALDALVGLLLILCQKPHVFNERLQEIGENAPKAPKPTKNKSNNNKIVSITNR